MLRVLTRVALTIRRKASSEPLCSWTDTSGPEPAWDQLGSWRWGRGKRTGEASRDQTSRASRGARRCVSASPSKREGLLGASMAEETRVIYHLEDQDTPYLVRIGVPAQRVTLADFKQVLNRPHAKFFFKSVDDDFG